MRRGANLPSVAGFNQTVILDAIRRAANGVSRVELVEQTGLASQTISNVCRRLIEQGWIAESGKLIEGPGKPRVILNLVPNGAFAIGVHLDPALITYTVVDLSGRIVAARRERTPSASRPAELIREIVSSVEDIMRAPGVRVDRVLGIGIASPGPIDAARGIVADPPLLEGWKNVPLRDSLAEATGLPVVLEKDVTSAVVAELWMGRAKGQDFAFFYLGTGIGIGLALDGEAYRGSSGNAGEGGTIYAPVSGFADGRGADMLGRLATPGYLVQEASREHLLEPPDNPHDLAQVEAKFAELLALADNGDRDCLRLLDRAADFIGIVLTSVVNLLDMSEIVVGGPYWEKVALRFQPRIAAWLNSSPDRVTHHPVRLSLAQAGEDVAALGAACLILDGALSPRPSSLMIAG